MLLIEAIVYPFKERGWLGKAFRVGLSILLFGAPPFGYAVRIAQAVSDNQDQKLPETKVLDDFTRGLQILVAFIVYTVIPFLIIRARPYPSPITNPANIFTLNIDYTGIIVQAAINNLIALPFTLAFIVGFVRFITTDSFIQFFNLPKSLDYFREHYAIILSNYLQAYLATWLFMVIGNILVFTICGFFICYGWIFFIWGYTIGNLARQLNLSWQAGKSQVTFGFK